MKKTTLLLAICIILATFLTACGENYDAQISSLEEQLSKLQQESDAQKGEITDLKKENQNLRDELDGFILSPRYDWDNPIILDLKEYFSLIRGISQGNTEMREKYLELYYDKVFQITGICGTVQATVNNFYEIYIEFEVLYEGELKKSSIIVDVYYRDISKNIVENIYLGNQITVKAIATDRYNKPNFILAYL